MPLSCWLPEISMSDENESLRDASATVARRTTLSIESG
jgi:hypothetical protein